MSEWSAAGTHWPHAFCVAGVNCWGKVRYGTVTTHTTRSSTSLYINERTTSTLTDPNTGTQHLVSKPFDHDTSVGAATGGGPRLLTNQASHHTVIIVHNLVHSVEVELNHVVEVRTSRVVTAQTCRTQSSRGDSPVRVRSLYAELDHHDDPARRPAGKPLWGGQCDSLGHVADTLCGGKHRGVSLVLVELLQDPPLVSFKTPN